MIQSMTAFASRTGSHGPWSWAWEMRGVNARGLDLRLRLPDGLDGLESALRSALGAALARGSVSVGLRLTQDDAAAALTLDAAQLDRVLDALDRVQERAMTMGITLGQPTAADVLGQRGVIVQGPGPETGADGVLAGALIADIAPLVAAFTAMRTDEGAALAAVLTAQIDRVATLTDAAADAAEARRPEVRAALTAALRRVIAEAPGIDEPRVAQELALLATKSDVTEEIDRLRVHVAAARALLAAGGPCGRKLDFLMQEFNREANTLCSKAGSATLTGIGLDLKAEIDRMREQVQNVE